MESEKENRNSSFWEVATNGRYNFRRRVNGHLRCAFFCRVLNSRAKQIRCVLLGQPTTEWGKSLRSFPRVAIKPGEVILPCYYNPVPSVNYIAEDAIRASHVIPNAYSNDTSTEYEISPTNWKLYAVLISTDSPEPRRSIFRRSNCSSVCVCVWERERERENVTKRDGGSLCTVGSEPGQWPGIRDNGRQGPQSCSSFLHPSAVCLKIQASVRKVRDVGIKTLKELFILREGLFPVHIYLCISPRRDSRSWVRPLRTKCWENPRANESPRLRGRFPRSKRDKAELRLPVVLLKSIPSGTSNFKESLPSLPRGNHVAPLERHAARFVPSFPSPHGNPRTERERERERERKSELIPPRSNDEGAVNPAGSDIGSVIQSP